MEQSRRISITALAAALVLAAGIVAAATARDQRTVTEAIDELALNASVNFGASSNNVRTYSRLVEILPNAKDSGGAAITDSVVVGRISTVAHGIGFARGRVTGFDDPLAAWRTLHVTVAVDTVIAGAQVPTLTLDWALLGSTASGEDAAAIGRALRALERVAVFSKALPDGPEHLGLTRQIPDLPFGLAHVDDDGRLTFPYLALQGASATDYMDGVDTVAELKNEAGKPSWVKG
jgi:hypothetical protein